jgi:hypothetical protein
MKWDRHFNGEARGEAARKRAYGSQNLARADRIAKR